MKLTLGHVTNSSSSSFVIWGIEYGDTELTDELYLEAHRIHLENTRLKNDGRYEWVKERFEILSKMSPEEAIAYMKDMDFEEVVSILFSDTGIGFYSYPQDDSHYIGITVPDAVKHFPDVMLKDIPVVVAREIEKTIKKPIASSDVRYIEEFWFDG